jgi:hypothetical protein
MSNYNPITYFAVAILGKFLNVRRRHFRLRGNTNKRKSGLITKAIALIKPISNSDHEYDLKHHSSQPMAHGQTGSRATGNGITNT